MKMNSIDMRDGVKIAYITVHVGENFGSALQAIATSRVLKNIGANPVLVNYIPPRVTLSGFLKRGFCSITGLIKTVLKLYPFLRNKKIFETYIREHCTISCPIYHHDDFRTKCPNADVYLTGSDQVWNFVYNEGFDGHYYFQGINGRKISYAASMGMTILNDSQKELLVKNLKEYDYLSVREDSARTLLADIGINNVKVLIDPTMMLTNTDWSLYAAPRIIQDPYLFVYMPYNIKDENAHYRLIKKIATEKRLKIVSFSLTYLKDRFADITVKYPTPGDFLSLIKYADFVVTNSFHGSAFSITLAKNFISIKPNKFETRLSNILQIVGLSNRLINGLDISELTPDFMSPIDYDSVNKVLSSKRDEAYEFLKKAIK